MDKKYIVSFGVTSTFIITFSVILLMIMFPQSVNFENVDSYIDIEKEDYTFKQTKGILDENLSYQYNITGEDIENFKITNKYKMGNQNPFYSNEK